MIEKGNSKQLTLGNKNSINIKKKNGPKNV